MISLAAGRKRVEPSRFALDSGVQELLKFFPQVFSASPRCAAGDDPRDDRQGGDLKDEIGVVMTGCVVAPDGGWRVRRLMRLKPNRFWHVNQY